MLRFLLLQCTCPRKHFLSVHRCHPIWTHLHPQSISTNASRIPVTNVMTPCISTLIGSIFFQVLVDDLNLKNIVRAVGAGLCYSNYYSYKRFGT
jgi:hypothetical protein